MTASAAPFALHTAPSGKVTKWGAPGTDQVFTTKANAESFIKGLAAHTAAKRTVRQGLSDILDGRATADSVLASVSPKAMAQGMRDLGVKDPEPKGAAQLAAEARSTAFAEARKADAEAAPAPAAKPDRSKAPISDDAKKAARRARRAARLARLTPEQAAARKAKRSEARKARREAKKAQG